MNTFKFVHYSKNDVRVRLMFDKMVFDPSLWNDSTQITRKYSFVTFLQVDAVFQRNDNNHDGKLNLEEFQEFMQGHAERRNSKQNWKFENHKIWIMSFENRFILIVCYLCTWFHIFYHLQLCYCMFFFFSTWITILA